MQLPCAVLLSSGAPTDPKFGVKNGKKLSSRIVCIKRLHFYQLLRVHILQNVSDDTHVGVPFLWKVLFKSTTTIYYVVVKF